MEMLLQAQQREINQQTNEIDAIYHNVATYFGLSDSAFWVLYVLAEPGATACSQNDLCNDWYFPKQTIHSAIQNLAERGYVRLEAAPDARNRKLVLLTDSGRQFVQQNVLVLYQAELRALDRMQPQERETYVALFQKHVALLREETDRMMAGQGGDFA